MATLKAWAGPLAERVLAQIFPPVCLVCDGPVATPDGLCITCWSRLRPITEPRCPVLGLPFAVDLGPGAVSAEALADPPPFDRARSAVIYDALARRLVSRLKYGDRPEFAVFCGRMMVSASADLLAEDAVLVPVPLHWTRQWHRRYNQSSELARVVARISGLPVETGLVGRSRRTSQQVGLSSGQRARNVSGAFAVDAAGLARLAGRRVILVDDVITTGATVSAVARALKRNGVLHVDVMSFARVVIGADMAV